MKLSELPGVHSRGDITARERIRRIYGELRAHYPINRAPPTLVGRLNHLRWMAEELEAEYEKVLDLELVPVEETMVGLSVEETAAL